MLTFRQKILIANLFVFLSFLALMYPIASKSVKAIIFKSLEERATELLDKIIEAESAQDMINRLKLEESQLFFRVSILNDKGGILYDTHTKKLLGSSFKRGYIHKHPEVEHALKLGSGYAEGYSSIQKQDMTYYAKRFISHDDTYVIRTAFPYKHVTAMTDYVVYSFSILGIAILLLYSVMTWFILQHFTDPIEQIILAIKPYQEGEQDHIPEIHLSAASATDEFYSLAHTLNSLSERVQNQITTLTQERNEKEAVLESLSDGVIAVDETMKITFINDMALKMLKFKKEELLGQNFETIGNPEFQELLICTQEEQQICKISATLGERPKTFLFVVASPQGEEKGAILVLQDKSSHFRMLEMRKDFISNASHELKTPITIIQGFAETLHDNPGLPKETASEITQKIVYNCMRMTNIVKNLLILADIENLPRSRIQTLDLSDLVENTYHGLLSVYPDAVMDVHKESEDVTFAVDPDLMEVAIRNLFDNAAKYSTGAAQISVYLKKTKKHFTIKISDKGIGIPEQELDRVFNRFYTVSKTNPSKLKSSGLGLSIVETIIAKHYGKISATSSFGEGTTFTIQLPLEQPRR
ncbi:MAG: two-component system phosphate regulon sensor histidine kinase PhoR [Chlamydiales bacterium]|jgi:two-component system phosphate regulon sensor histidine kinase PhoR